MLPIFYGRLREPDEVMAGAAANDLNGKPPFHRLVLGRITITVDIASGCEQRKTAAAE